MKITVLVVAFSLIGQSPPARNNAPRTPSIEDLRNLPYASPVSGDPKQAVGVLSQPNRYVQAGYNFYSDRFADTACLMTNDGRVMHEWKRTSSASWGEAIPTPDGDLLAIELWDEMKRKEYPHEIPFASRLIKLSPDSKLLWTSHVPVHHDLQLLKNGEILTLTERKRLIRSIDPKHLTIDNGIAWLSPAGALLHEISLYDIVRRSPLIKLGPVKPDFRDLVDLFHSNSVRSIGDVPFDFRPPGRAGTLYQAGNLLVCSRHQNFVAIIDSRKRRVLWAWGQDDLSGPHSARMLPSGDVLIFDNGIGRGASRVVEVDPRTNRIVWQYRSDPAADFYSGTGGAAQRLANGNTLVTDSWRYSAFEITAEGRIVWKFVSPGKSFVYRLQRYGEDYFTPEIRKVFRAETPNSQPGG